MPRTNYLNFTIAGQPVDVESIDEVPVSINYELENADNFSEKKSSAALDITLPATLGNDKIFGSFHNPNVESMSGKDAMDCIIEANGMQIFKGKALLTSGITQYEAPKNYKIDCYGNNGDWMLPLNDKTIYDFITAHTHVITEATVISSWAFNGLSEVNDYVYAPVRYKSPFADNDTRVNTLQLRPSISIYWIIWRAFKSLGYKIKSAFLDTAYFRKQVMPWTWGNFLFMESSKLDPLKFKATGLVTIPSTLAGDSIWTMTATGSTTGISIVGTGTTGSGNITKNTFEMSNEVAPEGYDNGGNYTWMGDGIMRYTYNTLQANVLGVTNLTFSFTLLVSIGKTGILPGPKAARVSIDWTKSTGGSGNVFVVDQDEPGIDSGTTIYKDVIVPSVPPGCQITFAILVDYESSTGNGIIVSVNARQLDSKASYIELTGIAKTEGSIVDFKLYDEFKNYPILDLFRGLIDSYDLQFQSDPISKVVVIEPAYPYYLSNNPASKTAGYFLPSIIDWAQKKDHSKETELELYRDIEQNLVYKFKDDSNDGGVKVLNVRTATIAGSSLYQFPSRFNSGKKENENRFFAPTAHVEMTQWSQFSNGGAAPQVIALIPENISNTSADASEYKFQPRIAFYKGVDLYNGEYVNGRFNFNGHVTSGAGDYVVPSMFTVNYKKGGEFDPVLAYNDQNVPSLNNTKGVVVHGLMRRFFLQRMAIMRYGKRVKAWYNLTTGDITNFYHREAIVQDNAIYHLFNIYGYMPLKEVSTQCQLWKFYPITQVDSDNCFPSLSSVGTGVLIGGGKDTIYSKLMLLQTDIPQ